MSQCLRCGKCCIEFIRQIHYKSTELEQFSSSNQNLPIFQIFLKHKELFVQHDETQMNFYVPIKQDISPLLLPDEKVILSWKLTSQNQNECLFLEWDSANLPVCSVHSFKPLMCKNYPDNRVGVCLNRKHLAYTHEFFMFQKSQVEMAIRVLKEFYCSHIQDPLCYDILALLMDFGKFCLPKVKVFLMSELNASEERFNDCISLLHDLILIHIYDTPDGRLVDGVSTIEIKKTVQKIMKERNWV